MKTLDEQVVMLKEALQNMMGVYNTPLSRRRFPPDTFMKEVLKEAETALKYYEEEAKRNTSF